MIASKLRELDCPLIAANLLENRDKVIQYLRDNNWTVTDMTSQWETDVDGDLVSGKMTDHKLINTKGVCINPEYGVNICHWNQDADETYPYIWCNKE